MKYKKQIDSNWIEHWLESTKKIAVNRTNNPLESNWEIDGKQTGESIRIEKSIHLKIF